MFGAKHQYIVIYTKGVGEPHHRARVVAENETDAATKVRNRVPGAERILDVKVERKGP